MVEGKQPAYGGEAEAARLRRHLDEVQQNYLSPEETAAILARVDCQHPAILVARVCASCDTIMEME